MINVHTTARVSSLADIEDSVRGSKIIISAGVVIDSFVKIKPAGGSGDLLVGANTTINSGCVLYTGNGIVIGSDCAVAANCTFAPTNHQYERKDKFIRQQGFRHSKGGIHIGNDVWIGANCVILDGAVIGEGCVVGAASLVKRNLEPYGIYAGIPLRKIGERS